MGRPWEDPFPVEHQTATVTTRKGDKPSGKRGKAAVYNWNQMEVYRWEKYRSKWEIFRQAMFDYQRVIPHFKTDSCHNVLVLA